MGSRPVEPAQRRRKAWTAAAVLAGLVILGIILTTMVFPALRTPEQVAADAAPPPPKPISARVVDQTLTSKVVLRALVLPGATVDVKATDMLSAAGLVVTSLPSPSPATVTTGTVVAEADGEPLIAFNWPFPAYRDLHVGDTGPDVRELQKSLGELGYSSGSTGTFDTATLVGASQLYADLGYALPKASEQTPAPSKTAQSPTLGSLSSSPASVSAGGAYVPARDIVTIPRASSAVTSAPLKVGQKIEAGAVLLRLDGQSPSVAAIATADRAARIKRDMTGVLYQEDGTQSAVTVAKVGSDLGDLAGLGTGIRIDLSFASGSRAQPTGAGRGSLKLELTLGTPTRGLTLPITAIYSDQRGGTYVIPLKHPDQKIPVRIRANVEGTVQLEDGSGLKAGDDVVLGTSDGGLN